MEKLAFESELGSKGHLSNIERGLARPNIQTLKVLADRLGVKLLDVVCIPSEDDRQRLIDRMRKVPRGPIRKILNDLGEQNAKRRKSGKAAAATATVATKPSQGSAAEAAPAKGRKSAKAAVATSSAAPAPARQARARAPGRYVTGRSAQLGASPADGAAPAAPAKRARKPRAAR